VLLSSFTLYRFPLLNLSVIIWHWGSPSILCLIVSEYIFTLTLHHIFKEFEERVTFKRWLQQGYMEHPLWVRVSTSKMKKHVVSDMCYVLSSLMVTQTMREAF
jgi:hypothetical protein